MEYPLWMKRNVIAIEHSGISSMKWSVTLLLLNTVNILYEVKRNVIAIEHSEHPLWNEA